MINTPAEGLLTQAHLRRPLKRGYGWDRSRIDTTESARIWVGHGVLAHNLIKISALTG